MQVVAGALFWNFGSIHWTPAAGYTYWAHAQSLVLAEISSSEIVAWAQKPPIYQALNRAMSPGAVGSLATPQNCCQVPAERDMCAYGCICVAAVAPRPLFITSWCLRATCRRFRPRREECLSRSLVLPLSFLIACLRPFSPACHRRGRRHRRSCESPTSKSPTNRRKHQSRLSSRRACCNAQWSRSCTCPFHSSWK